MMAQHVGRPSTAQPAILLLLVHVFVAQLASNVINVSATSSGFAEAVILYDGYDWHDDTSFATPVAQPAVSSARLITAPELYALSVPVNTLTDGLPVVELFGAKLDYPDVAIRWSPWPRGECPHHPDYTLDLAWVSRTANRGIFQFRTEPDPSLAVVYFCLRYNGSQKWINLGQHVSIEIPVRSV